MAKMPSVGVARANSISIDTAPPRLAVAWFEVLLYLLLGLTPLLWFSHGQLITGGDIDYPLDPLARLHDRIFAWNAQFLGGTDRSLDVSTLFFSLVEAVGFAVTRDVVVSEKISFVFWFTAAGFAMAYFLKTAFPNRPVLRIAGVVLYMFNFYQFYNWEIARIGEISATIEGPLLFAAITALSRNSLPMRRVALLVAIGALVGMGIGVQPPALYALIIALTSYWIFETVGAIYDRDGARLRRLLAGAVVIPVAFCAVNALWILPEINFIVSSGYTDSSHGIDVFDVAGLLEWTSRRSSLLNNFELAGRIVFYDTWGGEPYLPGLYRALTTPWYRAIGMLLPMLAFGALYISRDRRVWYFAALALATLFLSKGTHPPFADLYPFLIAHIPGLWVIRAPWEKFALATTIAYSVLFGVSIEAVSSIAAARVRSDLKTYVRCIAVAGAGAAIIGFHYPLVLGESFPGEHGSIHYPGFHQTIPAYARAAARWVDTLPNDARILTLPDDRVSVYTWGYAAPLDITTRLFARPIVDRQYGEGTAPPQPADETYNELIAAILTGDTAKSNDLLHYFRISYILQRNDIRYNFYRHSTSPSAIAAALGRIPGLRLVKRFGAWDFYQYTPALPPVYAASNVIFLENSFSNIDADLVPPHADSAVVIAGLNAGSVRSSLQDVSPDVPVYVPYPLHVTIPPTQRVAELSAPFDTYASMSARYFPGAKSVVSIGPDDPTLTLIADSHSPYSFANGAKGWTAVDSTLVYIETGDRPVPISSVLEGDLPCGDVIGIAWKSGWAGFTTHVLSYPVVIPPRDTAIVQINHHVLGDLTIVTGTKRWTVPVEQPDVSRSFAGFNSENADVTDATIRARYEPATTPIIGATSTARNPFAVPMLPAYRFWHGMLTWTATNSTIVSIATGNAPVQVDALREGPDDVQDLVGVAFGSDWIGFGTRPLQLPILIPPHTHAIAQINHRIADSLTILSGRNGWRVNVGQPGGGIPEKAALLRNMGGSAVYVPRAGTYTLRLCLRSDAGFSPHLTIDNVDMRFLKTSSSDRCRGYEYGPIRISAGQHALSIRGTNAPISGAIAYLMSGPVAKLGDVGFVRESPVEGRINADVVGEFVLVFGDNYNSGWRLYRGHPSLWEMLTTPPVRRMPILVNGYANGWALSQSARQEYTLFFYPQVLLVAGMAIAAVSFVMIVLFGVIPDPKVQRLVVARA